MTDDDNILAASYDWWSHNGAIKPMQLKIALGSGKEPAMTIHPDGKITLGENAEPTEAAADKWLVERLRDRKITVDTMPWMRSDDLCVEAADRIEALSAENERLREALKDALSHCYNCGGDPHYIEEDEATGDHLWTDCPVCRSARAALGEQQ